jgi:EmrB/QacA subfamily drug resistance transporter
MAASLSASPVKTPAKGVILALAATAQFMVVLDATVVNVALPSIQHGLHFSQSSLQWVINGYTLLFGGFLLLGGRAADLFGRKRLFLIGVALFSGASVLNGFAGSAGMLVAGRALQGLGAALVSPAALSIITTTFVEGRERARALGVWSAISAGGGAFGLIAGGALTQALSWPWIFFVNAPIGVAAFVLATRYLPETRVESRDRVDVAGAVSVTAGLVVLVYAIVKAQAWGFGSARTIGLVAASAALLTGFVAIQLRSRAPLVRLRIFRKRSLAGANAVMLLVVSGMFAMFFFVSIYVQELLGYSPLKAGVAFLPLTGGIIVGAAIAQQLIARIGVRTTALIGMSLASVGLLLLGGLPVDGRYAADLLPSLVIIALGLGLAFAPITLMATANVEARDAGLASGLLNTAQQVGGALGLAVLSTLAADRTSSILDGASHGPSAAERASALVNGFHSAFVAGAGLMATGVILMAVLLRNSDVARINTQGAALAEA